MAKRITRIVTQSIHFHLPFGCKEKGRASATHHVPSSTSVARTSISGCCCCCCCCCIVVVASDTTEDAPERELIPGIATAPGVERLEGVVCRVNSGCGGILCEDDAAVEECVLLSVMVEIVEAFSPATVA